MAGLWYLNKLKQIQGNFSSEPSGNRVIVSSFYGQLRVYLGIKVLHKLYFGRIYQTEFTEHNFTLFS